MLTSNTLSNTSLDNKQTANIVLFSIASFISLFGTSIYNFAIGLYVLKTTGSGLNFAVTLVISIVATILVNPLAGVFADRFNRKLLVISTDIINGILLLLLFFISIEIDLNLPMLYVSIFLLNIFSTVYGISLEAAKPNLVSTEKLISVNSINKVIESSSTILGPMAGGMVFAFMNIRFFILANGISFILSAALEIFMNFKLNYNCKQMNKVNLSFWDDIKEGVFYIHDKKYILNLFITFIVLNFFIGLSINIPMPYIINNVLKLSPKYFGIIDAALPAGMILGAIAIKKIMEKYTYKNILKAANILVSFCMLSIGVPVITNYKLFIAEVYLVYFVLVMILLGTAISCIDIPIFYILQNTIADEIRGRVLSLGMSLAKIVLPIALIISGALISVLPAFVLPAIGGICLCIFTIFTHTK